MPTRPKKNTPRSRATKTPADFRRQQRAALLAEARRLREIRRLSRVVQREHAKTEAALAIFAAWVNDRQSVTHGQAST